jgi:hypothetical protein
MAIGGLLILGFVVIVISLVFQLTAPGIRLSGALQKWKHLARWIFGATGLLLVAAVAIGTMHRLQEVYRAEAAANSTMLIQAPAKPGITPPKLDRVDFEVPFEGRFLLQSLVLSKDGRILHTETHDFTWPRDKGKTIKIDLHSDGTNTYIEKTLHTVNWRSFDSKAVKAFIRGKYQYRTQFGRAYAYGEYHCDEDGDTRPRIGPYSWKTDSGKPFSLNFFDRIDDNQRILFDTIVPIQNDDPLIMQSTYRFLNEQLACLQRRNLRLIGKDVSSSQPRNEYSNWTSTPRLILLNAQIGQAFLVLLAGAILVAQFFRNKAVKSIVAAFLAIIFVVVLDRIVLDRNLGVLCNAGQPPRMRIFACSNAALTFFHRARTEEVYDRLMREKDTPPELRRAIQRAAEMCQEPKLYNTSRLPSEDVLLVLLKNGTPRNQATLAELQKNNPRCLWFQQDQAIVGFPVGGNSLGGDYEPLSVLATANSRFAYSTWPSGVVYRRLLKESNDTVAVEFSLEDEISKDLGLEKGKIWSARFTKQEIFQAFGMSSPSLFPEEYAEDWRRHLKQRFLLAHAGVLLK